MGGECRIAVRVIPPLAEHGHLALDEAELVAWGERFGRAAAAAARRRDLTGELGAGKTTLVQAICRGYGVTDDVTSPTFALVHRYVGAAVAGLSSRPLPPRAARRS